MYSYDVSNYPANRPAFDWVSENTRKFMAKGYLDDGVTPEQRALQIVESYHKRMLSMGYPSSLADYNATILRKGLEQGHVSFSTPAWVSYGLSKGLAISCFGSDIGHESMEDILFAASEIGMLTKYGGGTSINLNKLRSRGTPISVGGKADGAAHFASLFNSIMKIARQGEARRGYCAAYLNADHGDIDEFLDIGRDNSELQNITTGIIFPENYLAEAAKGDKSKQDVILKAAKVRSEIGYPYIGFQKNMNAYRPQCYVDRDMEVDMSNLCVTGDTKILTDSGYQPIQNLAGQTVNCWNGKEWSMTPIFQTSDGQEVLTVTLSNGQTIEATPYHKWYVAKQDSRGRLVGEVMKRTHELEDGDKLVKFDLSPVTHETTELPFAYESGFYTGDGCDTGKTDRLYFYEDKQSLLDFITVKDSVRITQQSEGYLQSRTYLDYPKGLLQPKFSVPSTNYSVESRLRWLAGYFDADGTLTDNNGTESIQAASTNLEFLQSLHLMLQELGVNSKISLSREAGYNKLPANDGTGQTKEYWTQATYRILIPGSELGLLLKLGYSANRVMPTDRKYNRKASQFVQVVSVVDENKVLPTYCGTEPKRNRLMFNGVLTGNCSEILLPNGLDESFVCVLSSLNLVHYDEWKSTPLVRVMISFLDTLVEESIEKIDTLMNRRAAEIGTDEDNVAGIFLQRIKRFLVRHRALGLGTMGLHHLYQSKMLPWESREAAQLNNEIFKHIRSEAEAATTFLADMLGEPEICQGYGRRNTTLLAIAPTKSSAAIMGYVSESIQPELSNYYVADLAKDTVIVKNPYLVKILESMGKNTPAVWESILEHDSLQHLDFLPDIVKAVFKTNSEIPVRSQIDQAATRQQYLDQTQSFNVIYHPDTPASEIVADIYYAEAMGLPTMYYQKSISPAQLNNQRVQSNDRDCLACSA